MIIFKFTTDTVVRRLRWVVLFVMLLDAAVTLIGQPQSYWHDPKQANEMEPIVRFFLVRGIIPYVVVGMLYVAAALFVASILPSRLGLILLFFILLGHFWGATSWFMYYFHVSIRTQQLFELAVAVLIALSIYPLRVKGPEMPPSTALDPTPTIVWISVTLALCLASFWLGGMKQSRASRELDAGNVLSLMKHKILLDELRANETTNAIAKLEAFQDGDILSIMSYEPSLEGKERYVLDKTLADIAHDRARYRKPIIRSTNEPAYFTNNPVFFRQIERDWAEREIRIQAFLDNIANQRHN